MRPDTSNLQESGSPSRRSRSAPFVWLGIGLLLASSGFFVLWWFNYFAPFFILMVIFVVSVAACLRAALLLEAGPIVTVSLAGLGLAILSFAYQPIGPERRLSGTECQPFTDCIDEVRGGGFPAQYMIDAPGITHWGALGFEDEFRFWHFLADISFYVCVVLLVQWMTKYRALSSRKGRANTA